MTPPKALHARINTISVEQKEQPMPILAKFVSQTPQHTPVEPFLHPLNGTTKEVLFDPTERMEELVALVVFMALPLTLFKLIRTSFPLKQSA
jgi:hypothetical protein